MISAKLMEDTYDLAGKVFDLFEQEDCSHEAALQAMCHVMALTLCDEPDPAGKIQTITHNITVIERYYRTTAPALAWDMK